METTRIKVYHNGAFIIDLLCPRKKTEAIELLRKGYPEFKDCVIVAEDFDISKPKNQNYIDAMLKCGMVL